MNYYNEIENYIKRNEVNKIARRCDANNDLLTTYWNVGRLIVEAQGGSTRAKYGNELIKEWSVKLTKKYGKGYDATNLRKFRQFYCMYPNCGSLPRNLTWTSVYILLPIKDKNKRNYYINLCIEKSLSSRELRNEIKSNSYERLLNKPKRIDIITPLKRNNITDSIKNPIIIELNDNEQIKNEHDLEILLLAKLKSFFNQLGNGFSFVDNQYRINYNNKNYYIDLLLFNINYNCYVVVELKIRELRKEDKGQIEFYMNLIDNNVKQDFHKNTIGIIITKEQDKFIANFVGTNNIIPLTYEVIKNS